jgi:pyruvate dehydrogenase E2 component (dihydrolipoamide acetyltransferase)
VLEIDRELAVLIEKARDGKLQPEEYQGATFTISNLGMFGIEEFTAIINPPGSAILTLGKIQKEPVFTEDGGELVLPGGGSLKLQSLMRVSLSCDHRVIDGVTGAAFLSDLKAMIEEPVQALY